MNNNNEQLLSSRRNIVLPIKPLYADKIISGEKKYEYRKRLCKDSIDKIYIYATSPVKKIIGEVKVLQKLNQKKEILWEISKEESGVSKEEFFKYFQKNKIGCAYYLGEVQKYNQPLTLESIGIKHTPQSYVYIGEI